MTKHEAQCPECKQWSAVSWFDDIPPGGYWWIDSGCCPQCGAVILVETECEFKWSRTEGEEQ